MINYVHCHIGQLPPDYLIDSFRTIDRVDPDARIIPKLKPGHPLHDMLPSLPEDEIKEQLKF